MNEYIDAHPDEGSDLAAMDSKDRNASSHASPGVPDPPARHPGIRGWWAGFKERWRGRRYKYPWDSDFTPYEIVRNQNRVSE